MSSIFSEKELGEVKSFLSSLDNNKLKLPLRQRKFLIGNLKLYYGPEQSRISIDHFISTLKIMPEILDIKTKIYIEEIFYGIIIANNVKEFYKEFNERIKNDTVYPEFLLNQYNKLKNNLILKFGKINSKLTNNNLNEKDLQELDKAVINFRALSLDDFLPLQVIAEKLQINNEELQILVTPLSGVSHFLSIHKGLLNLAKKDKIAKEDIEFFIENAGYMIGDDLFRITTEIPEEVYKRIEIYKSEYSKEDIAKEFEFIKSRLTILKEKQNNLISKFNDTKLHYLLLASAEYNELNRIFVKKYYKLLRNLAEKNNLPLKYISLDHLELLI